MVLQRAQAAYAPKKVDDDVLIRRYAPLIERVARRLAIRCGLPALMDDLWSAGALGLLDAASRFDAARDVKFESFAEHRIRGAMLDELRKLDHLPRRLRAQADKLKKAQQKLSHALAREPSADELAAETGLEIDEVEAILGVTAPALPFPEGFDLPDGQDQIDDAIARTQLNTMLTEAIGALPERLQILVSLYYVEGLTYREIAKILEVSEPRVCQLHGDAVKKMKVFLQERGA